MPYTHQYLAAIVIAVALVLLGAIQVAAGSLGVSPQLAAWLGVTATGLGALQGFLPRVTKAPDPARTGVD